MVIGQQSHRKRKKSQAKLALFLVISLAAIITVSVWYLCDNDKPGKNPNPDIKIDKTVYVSLPGAKKINALVSDYTQTDNIWALVSKTNPISTSYVPSNLMIASVATNEAKTDEERSIRSDINQPLTTLFNDAAANSYDLMIGSGYRSATLQAYYYNSSVSAYGEDAANQSIAKPGQSEHQLGLAVDISLTSRECYLEACFGDMGAGKWLAANSYKYGFILRYPSDKVDITGYEYEPWHFRYVGIDLATAIHESGLALDQAWPYLQTALQSLKENGAI